MFAHHFTHFSVFFQYLILGNLSLFQYWCTLVQIDKQTRKSDLFSESERGLLQHAERYASIVTPLSLFSSMTYTV